MIILGVDPGFASVGLAIVSVAGPGTRPLVLEAHVFETKKSKTKLKVYAADDNLSRLREILAFVADLLDAPYPGGQKVSALCCEAMSFPRNASAASKVALVWGGLTALAVARDMPIYQATPQQIKKRLCGTSSASKEDVEAAAAAELSAPVSMRNIKRSAHNHAWDAVGAVITCADSEEMKLMRKLHEAMYG